MSDHLKEFYWKPGVSPNPGGKPKQKPLSDALMKQLLAPSEYAFGKAQLPKNATRFDKLAQSMVKQALMGDTVMAKEIWNRVEGRVEDKLTVERNDTLTLNLKADNSLLDRIKHTLIEGKAIDVTPLVESGASGNVQAIDNDQ